MSTNSTPCFASVVKIRLGSIGGRAETVSDTSRSVQEFAHVLDLLEPVLRRHPEDARHFPQHVRSHHDARFQLRADVDARRVEQTLERLPGGAGLPPLDARDDRLRGAGSAREGALGETGALARLM